MTINKTPTLKSQVAWISWTPRDNRLARYSWLIGRAKSDEQGIDIRGSVNSGHVQQAARDLLCDPVTQEFRMVAPSEPVLNGMSHWRVEVWLKASVTDAVGDTVRSAIAEMGLPQPDTVRVGTVYHIAGKCGRNQLEKVVARGLANPVVHRFTVTETHS